MKDQKWFEDMELRIPHGEVRTRFAPSPTGYMHVGNLRTALYTYLIARHAGGKFILRIEDTDQGRYVEGAVDVIYSTMRACGLTHDEGPDVGGPVGPYVQTDRKFIDVSGRNGEDGAPQRLVHFAIADHQTDLAGTRVEFTINPHLLPGVDQYLVVFDEVGAKCCAGVFDQCEVVGT